MKVPQHERNWGNETWKWYSYEPVLTHLCKTLKPQEILEWGPGFSTSIMLTETDATILTVEHSEDYYNKAVDYLQGISRAEVVHRSRGSKPKESAGYVNYPIYRLMKDKQPLRKYDMIFVDGRARFDCLIAAQMLIKPKGIVVLHDAHREVYRPAVESYNHYKLLPDYRTAVMSPSPLPDMGIFL
jgi:predicted O-methyltransferase YrrM